MKAYPSIELKIDYTRPYVIFDKLDGSNIRAEWSPKKSFYKFGSRTQLLTPDQAVLYPVIEKVQNQFGEKLAKLFTDAKFERTVCFFEYHGPRSEFGNHYDPPEAMQATLIDISVYKKGLMVPEKLIAYAEKHDLAIPRVLHNGRIDVEFYKSVCRDELEGMTHEGVVGKSREHVQSEGGPAMFKIKTHKWLDKLKSFCNNDERMFQRLR